jgi:amidase
MTELWRMGAADLAEAIRAKEVKSREVVEALLTRIEQVNPKVNAITVTLADSALAAADAADRATANGSASGALHGVPITVKENIDCLGSATTDGIVAMAEAMPTLDAPQVGRLREQGAIPIARTNMPDFGMRWHTDNALRGASLNPWNAALTPGGSSGGEAVALATGMSCLGLGNDYGGSLRWPSQCNGTAALKPTFGRIATGSSIEPGGGGPITLQLYAVQGPMARHVRDLRLAFGYMVAPDPRDAWHVPAPLTGPAVPKRVAVCVNPGGTGVDPSIAAGVMKAADALRDAGYELEEVELPVIQDARDAWAATVIAELKLALYPMLQQIASADALTFLENSFEAVPELDYGGYMMAFAGRQVIANAWSEFAARHPLVLAPVATMQPFPVGKDLASAGDFREILDGLRLVVTGNLLGLPVAVVNAGVANGLPLGVQLIGARYREDLCLDAAEAIEDRLGVVTPIDPR